MSDHFLAGCEGAGTLSCSDPGAYIHNATCSVEVEVEVVMNSGFLRQKVKDSRSGVVTPTFNFTPGLI